MANILAIRFSAIGDVAMTVPVIYSFAKNFPEHTIIVVSTTRMKKLFSNLAENVRFIGVDLKKQGSPGGIFKLFKTLLNEQIDYVADLHNVPRTLLLRLLFKMKGVPCAHIHKGRFAKKSLTRKHNKKLRLLKTTTIRYLDVFCRLGFNFTINFKHIPIPENKKKLPDKILDKNRKNIGIAPFAKHKGKIYPLHLQEKVIKVLSDSNKIAVFLFGGGNEEKNTFNHWSKKYPNVTSLAEKFDFQEELAIIGRLDLMLTMDSANMHLASLTGTPVLSIWGATHPYCGFLGWEQSADKTIQINLPCRPCSVYGQKACWRKDFACMENISPTDILKKIHHLLFNEPYIFNETTESIPAQKEYKITFNPVFSEINKIYIKDLPSHFPNEGKLIQNVRNTLKIFTLPDGNKIVVKKYQRPIFVNRLIYGLWRKSKAARAYDYSLQLLNQGIETPKPIAYLEEKNHGLFSDSYFINQLSTCRFLYNHLALYPEFFKQKDEILTEIGKFTAQMHEKGFFHKDYSGGNLLFDTANGEIKVEVIDLNRMSFGKITQKEGCKAFERLLGDEDFIKKIATAYAIERNFDVEECINDAIRYRNNHLEKNGSKYLSAIYTASFFSPLTEKLNS